MSDTADTKERKAKRQCDRYSDSDDSEDNYRRKKEKRKSHRSRKSRHRDDNDDDNSSVASRGSDYYEKQRKRKKQRKHHYSSSSSDDEDNYRRRKKHHHSRKQKKKKKKKHRKSKREYDSECSSSGRDERKRRKQSKMEQTKEEKDGSLDRLSRNYDFVNALRSLFTYHPDMATELPYIFIRLAQGTSLDLTQMSNTHASESLANVFQSLSSFGLALDGKSWKWTEGSNASNNQDLILIKISKILLDEVGITVQAVNEYENPKMKTPTTLPNTDNEAIPENRDLGTKIHNDDVPSLASSSSNDIETLTQLMLTKFDSNSNDRKEALSGEQVSLAKGLVDMCQMIQQDEIISIDNIPDQDLKVSLDKLFSIIGCVKEEMEQDDDDDDNNDNDNDDGGFGFVMPENETKDAVMKNIHHVIQACQRHQQLSNNISPQNQTKKRVIGPSLPPPTGSSLNILDIDNDLDSSDDDVGPSPFIPGTTMAKRKRIRPSNQSIATTENEGNKGGKREEWMMVPGEHDFLKDVMTTDGALKSRKFRNEKSAPLSAPSVPIDPKVQKEINAIKQAYAEARGPSLMEMHQQKKKEEAASSNKKTEWKWSREDDLDKGRRVDKNALQMVLGGASDGLNDKFQGSFSTSFM